MDLAPGAKRKKFFDRLSAKVVEDRFWNHRFAVEIHRQSAEFVRRIAEAAELLAKKRLGHREFLRAFQWPIPLDGDRLRIIRELNLKQLADMRFDVGMQSQSPDDDIAGKRMFQTLANGRIVGFPDQRAGVDRGEIDVAAPKLDFDLVTPARLDGEDATPLLVL